MEGLAVEISEEMNSLILSLPDLTENELKIRSNFFKSRKNGSEIHGLTRNLIIDSNSNIRMAEEQPELDEIIDFDN